MTASTLVLGLGLFLFSRTTHAAQESISYFAGLNAGLGDPGNLVYMLLVIFFVMVYFTPILAYIYRVFLIKLVKEVTARAKEIQAKISERVSDAGRKLSERMRA